MAVQPRTSRQQQKSETRRRLFHAAAALFAAQGYHDTTVDQIAKQAGVAKGTFFVHFATKDAVITELLGIQTHAASKARDATLAGGGTRLDALRAAVLTLAVQADHSKSVTRACLVATLDNPLVGTEADTIFARVMSDLTEDARVAQQQGLLARHTDPKSIATALMSDYLGAAFQFCQSPKATSVVDILRPLVDAHLAGFGARLEVRDGRSKARRSPRRR